MVQPGSVVVEEGCYKTEVPGSMLGGYLKIFRRKNGIACLRKGKLLR